MSTRSLPTVFPTASRPRFPTAPDRRPTAPDLSLYYYVIPGAAPEPAAPEGER